MKEDSSNKLMKLPLKTLFNLVVAGIDVWICCRINIAIKESVSHSIFTIILLALFYYMINSFFTRSNVELKMKKYAVLFGWIFSIFWLLGYALGGTSDLELGKIVGIAIKGLFLSPVVAEVYVRVNLFYQKHCWLEEKCNTSGKRRKFFILCFLTVLICWGIVFLTYYPGLFNYDVYSQIPQALNNDYNKHHPLLHTLLLGKFYLLGGRIHSYNFGIAMYTIMQMVFFDFAVSTVMLYLYDKGLRKLFIVISLLFFTCFPSISIMAISATKDIYFVAFLLMLTVLLARVYEDMKLLYEIGFWIKFLICAVGMCLFRNNAFYALIVVGIIAWIWLQGKKNRCVFVILIVCSVFSAKGGDVILTAYLDAKPGPEVEMLSVPIQQLARVYNLHGNELSCDEKQELLVLMPGIGDYNPYKSDEVKNSAKIEENYREFINLYLKYFKSYPITYIDAFLCNTQGYWFVDDTTNTKMYGEGYEGRQGYLLTDTKEGFGVYHVSHFRCLENIYETLFSANKYLRIPVVACVFSPAFFSWIMVFLLFKAFYEQKKKVKFCMVLLVALMITLLMGPCAIIRYSLPFVVCMPLLIGMFAGGKRGA